MTDSRELSEVSSGYSVRKSDWETCPCQKSKRIMSNIYVVKISDPFVRDRTDTGPNFRPAGLSVGDRSTYLIFFRVFYTKIFKMFSGSYERTARDDTSRLSSYCAHRETLMWLAKVSEGSSPWVFGTQLRVFYWIYQWFWDIDHKSKTRYLDLKFWL